VSAFSDRSPTRSVVVGAQGAGHLDTVELGQAEVEHDQIGRERAALLERALAVAGGAHLIALHPQ
jgi:hypothetical protein